MNYAKEYSTAELMAVFVARQINNDDKVFIGIGIPLIAGALASLTHAPDSILLFEAGGIGPHSRRIPWTIADNPTTDNALSCSPMWSILMDCQRGFVTKAVIGGAEIDRFGNLNSSQIPGDNRDFQHPVLRLGGSGGANDLASSARETIIMMRLEKRRFVNKINFVTSPGYFTGPGEREKYGLKGNGPFMVATTRCYFRFDQNSKEMYLAGLFPGATVEEIKGYVEWDLKVASELEEVKPPTLEELEILHTLDPANLMLGSGAKPSDFEEFYQQMMQSNSSILYK